MVGVAEIIASGRRRNRSCRRGIRCRCDLGFQTLTKGMIEVPVTLANDPSGAPMDALICAI
jgi:hypothetical protein